MEIAIPVIINDDIIFFLSGLTTPKFRELSITLISETMVAREIFVFARRCNKKLYNPSLTATLRCMFKIPLCFSGTSLISET